MSASIKSATKQTEAELQRAVVKYIKLLDSDAEIIANPFSELQLQGSDAYRFKVLANMKAAGWEKSQPDLIVIGKDYQFAMELKTEEANPFRPFRGGGMWIEKTKDKHLEHVLAQAVKLNRLDWKGITSYFISGLDQATAFARCMIKGGTIEGYATKTYEFSYGKYTPEHYWVNYLEKNQ